MNFLFVSAHPDDLEFSCANLIRYLAQKGHEVRILCLTKGEFGIFDQNWIGPRLARIRVQELHKAAKINAIPPEKIFFGEFIDGFLKFTSESVNKIISWLNRLQPDIIFAPEAFYAYYFQTDHINCGKIMYYIFHSCQDRLLKPIQNLYFYNTLNPNFWWPFNDLTLGKQSFLQHRSQWWFIRWIMLFYSIDKVNFWWKQLGPWKYAERYRRISKNLKVHYNTTEISTDNTLIKTKNGDSMNSSIGSMIFNRILSLISHLPAFNPTRERYKVKQVSSEFAQKVEKLCDRFYPE